MIRSIEWRTGKRRTQSQESKTEGGAWASQWHPDGAMQSSRHDKMSSRTQGPYLKLVYPLSCFRCDGLIERGETSLVGTPR
jgi:hypothetical protein